MSPFPKGTHLHPPPLGAAPGWPVLLHAVKAPKHGGDEGRNRQGALLLYGRVHGLGQAPLGWGNLLAKRLGTRKTRSLEAWRFEGAHGACSRVGGKPLVQSQGQGHKCPKPRPSSQGPKPGEVRGLTAQCTCPVAQAAGSKVGKGWALALGPSFPHLEGSAQPPKAKPPQELAPSLRPSSLPQESRPQGGCLAGGEALQDIACTKGESV